MSKRAPKTAAAAAICLCLIFAEAAVSQDLSGLYRITDGVFRSHVEYHGVKIAPGKESSLAEFQGPGKATYFYFTDDTGGKFYQGLVLKVFWDDEKEPSIQVPLADFFGAIGGRTIDYQSAPCRSTTFATCVICRCRFRGKRGSSWPTTATRNTRRRGLWDRLRTGPTVRPGEEPFALHVAAEQSREGRRTPLDRSIDPSQCGGKNNYNTRHTILDVKGRGQYVGDFLQVYSRNAAGGARATRSSTSTARPSSIRPARRTSTVPAGDSAGPSPRPTAAICRTIGATTACTAGTCPTPCGSKNR